MDPDIQDHIRARCERYLSIRPRSEKEMHLYLKRILFKKAIKEPDDQQTYIDYMMNDLVETGRVDDMSFARWYVAEKNYFKPRGRIRLKAELSQKGISTDIIDKALAESEFTDKDLLHKLLSKYLMFESDLTDKEKLKLIQKLQRKGFSFSDSKSAIEEFLKKE